MFVMLFEKEIKADIGVSYLVWWRRARHRPQYPAVAVPRLNEDRPLSSTAQAMRPREAVVVQSRRRLNRSHVSRNVGNQVVGLLLILLLMLLVMVVVVDGG
jgi:hypothetical protein